MKPLIDDGECGAQNCADHAEINRLVLDPAGKRSGNYCAKQRKRSDDPQGMNG